ncbi:Crp/Fnr family transcriptional regulator [Wenyingzhuangia sp. chi5]|uniref:Crp/Fnr family transcriptional regulator n=1 Tax=Wenyingzhuangia gilva TaxID=3057677 RepID=A0ABT8VP71_9FLAO|nr:Crp/Fnr family transcriptional regulator [Wenyingzhuangia sp. chi5]MDO3693766.1 Crp/Fnr family transcriptional regulator [Wenyingzhuangia sp. chi5]
MKQALRHFIESFQFLTPEEVTIIVDNTVLRNPKKGEILLREGDVSRECYAVVKGCIREYIIKDGVEKTVSFFVEGDPVNSFSSEVTGCPSKSYFECLEDCIVTVGNDSLIDDMIVRVPRLEKLIRREVEKEAGKMQDRMSSFMISTPEERFVTLINNQPNLIHRVPQVLIASYIGVTPESYSRIKKRVFAKIKEKN